MVFCAALFEEKLWSHRVLVNFARYLAQRGVSVLRFDYFGDGESEGRFDEASVSSRVSDIADAVSFCRDRTQVDRVYLLGLCYGATLAIRAALQQNIGDGVIAWSPVMNGERYAGELLRAHLSTQMIVHRKVLKDREALTREILSGQTVNIEGYEVGRALYSEMLELDPLALLGHARRRALVVQISPSENVDSQYAPLGALRNPAVEFRRVKELKFWMQQKSVFPPCEALFAQSAEWLMQSDAHGSA